MSNLPNRFTVDVTAEDIANGEAGKAYRCPVALAAARCVGWASVFRFGWALLGSDDRAGFTYRHNAEPFIAAFDSEQPVQPCTVTFTRHVEQ